jgi:hypothetical protein
MADEKKVSNWIYKAMMAGGVVLGAVVTGGLLPVGYAGVAIALGTAGGYFHVSEAQKEAAKQ